LSLLNSISDKVVHYVLLLGTNAHAAWNKQKEE